MTTLSLEELKLQKAVLEHALETNKIDSDVYELTIEKIEAFEIENYKQKRNNFIDIHRKITDNDIYNVLVKIAFKK